MEDFGIQGAAELDRALQAFPANVEKNILRGALRAGAKLYEQEAKARVPFRSGKLRNSIRISVRVLFGRIVARVVAGGNRKGDAFYAHMVEGGTRPHEIRPKHKRSLFFAGVFSKVIAHPGAKGKPFMRRAFQTETRAALDRVVGYTRARIAREAKRR